MSNRRPVRAGLPRLPRNWLIALALAVVTFIVYFQVRQFDFVGYDDTLYVVRNAHLAGGVTFHNLLWALTTNDAMNWHPVTWLSYLVEFQLWGCNPGAMHLVNVLIHIAAAVVFFYAFNRMTGAPWRSALVAALFALHPVHVESVAWIAERKDVLSAFFCGLTLLAYLRYLEEPGKKFYLLSLGCFLLGLMSKPMAMTWPFVLLLLDYWPLGRTSLAGPVIGKRKSISIGRLIEEKLPFLGLAALTARLAVWSQSSGGALISSHFLPLDIRLGNVLVSYVRYIGMMFWPVHLAITYPYAVWRPGTIAAAAAILVSITAVAFGCRRRAPFLFVGWLWYIGMLLPVIGLVQVGRDAVDDHAAYLPYIGLFIMIAWALPAAVLKRPAVRRGALAASVAAVTACAAMSWHQVGYWRNSETIFEHVLDITKSSPLAKGYVIWPPVQMEKAGRSPVRAEIRLMGDEPNVAEAHLAYAIDLRSRGKFQQAVREYKEALRLTPDETGIYLDLGDLLASHGEFEEALQNYKTAARLEPDDPDMPILLGTALSGLGKFDEAIAEFRTALRMKPDDADAHSNIGLALFRQNKIPEAIEEYREAIRLRHDLGPAHSNLGNALFKLGKIDEAANEYREALKCNPGNELAHNNLGTILSDLGQIQEAESEFRKALVLNPNNPVTHINLAHVLLKQKRTDEAFKEYDAAHRIEAEKRSIR